MTVGLGRSVGGLGDLRDLFGELSDLKRIRSAGRRGSIAERGFLRAWASLIAGERPHDVMLTSVASGLAAARLGDLDCDKLEQLGLSAAEAQAVLMSAFDAVAGVLDAPFARSLRPALACRLGSGEAPPPFAVALATQPRAGATCPGRPRLMLEPPENHAEHCWAVAVFGALMAPRYGADPSDVFLAGLSHHLHNASMPDAGFTGEMLLGAQLEPIVETAAARALGELAEPLRGAVVAARAILPDAATPAGRALHAADVVDRVLQLAQHLRPSQLTTRTLLHDWQLVHAGPVKSFHDAVLVEMGLA